jgi:hypothetical protein
MSTDVWRDLHTPSFTMNTEAAYFFEMFLPIYQIIRLHILVLSAVKTSNLTRNMCMYLCAYVCRFARELLWWEQEGIIAKCGTGKEKIQSGNIFTTPHIDPIRVHGFAGNILISAVLNLIMTGMKIFFTQLSKEISYVTPPILNSLIILSSVAT